MCYFMQMCLDCSVIYVILSVCVYDVYVYIYIVLMGVVRRAMRTFLFGKVYPCFLFNKF